MNEYRCSRRVRAEEFEQSWLRQRAKELGLANVLHRKLWEHCAIVQAFLDYSTVETPRALGFGVGNETIPAWFASYGINVIATDRPAAGVWDAHRQHAAGLEALNRGECDDAAFDDFVNFMAVNMSAIPDVLLRKFDFTWSSSCMEHLGGIDAGLDFFCNQMRCLKPGGVAAHTTEYVFSSNDSTLNSENLCLFRHQDLEKLAARMRAQGDELGVIDLRAGTKAADTFVDRPPYVQEPHLNLELNGFQFTSVLLLGFRGHA